MQSNANKKKLKIRRLNGQKNWQLLKRKHHSSIKLKKEKWIDG